MLFKHAILPLCCDKGLVGIKTNNFTVLQRIQRCWQTLSPRGCCMQHDDRIDKLFEAARNNINIICISLQRRLCYFRSIWKLACFKAAIQGNEFKSALFALRQMKFVSPKKFSKRDFAVNS